MSANATPSQSNSNASANGNPLMSSARTLQVPVRLHSLATLALLLEKLENQPGSASASQYRGVVRQVTALINQAEVDAELKALLDFFPATAELYENLHYASAGLCRAELGPLAESELQARDLLQRMRR